MARDYLANSNIIFPYDPFRKQKTHKQKKPLSFPTKKKKKTNPE